MRLSKKIASLLFLGLKVLVYGYLANVLKPEA